ncbi:hypothetical protein [Candidatus Magnetobacterium casense]|uniref:Uncharacterized protein n=1 Tax=Candidatus Magnetobacterium casense TaxID=1455061 RepID=A0ABS6S0V2_9BACT|nr:hypothetical protein [Candidatus Magnetobacterium casensis]MBV6342441.1 hypothetical protein [Candidatus Magnetobacterium casensis]
MKKQKKAKVEGHDQVYKACEQLVVLASGSGRSENLMTPSRSVFDDPFEGRTINGMIKPRVPSHVLCLMAHTSIILPQIFRALEIGIESFGHHYKPLLVKENDKYYDPKDPKKGDIASLIADEPDPVTGEKYGNDMAKVLDGEIERLERFYDNFATYQSFTDVRMQFRSDKEHVGFWTMEVLRDGRSIPCGGEHVPSYQVRLLVRDSRPTDVTIPRVGHNWRWVMDERPYYFRRYVQIRGNAKHYFKQFGDPRNFSYINGKQIADADAASAATEMIFCANYTPGTEYGEPDWLPHMHGIGGVFRAEMENFNFFANKLIPAILLLIMGGARQGDKAIARLLDAFDECKGENSQNRVVAAQIPSGAAEVTAGGVGKIDSPKALVHVLTQIQKQDATFQGYIENHIKRLMSSKRIPPLLLGLSSDYNKATSDAAERMCERWIAKPQRNQFDDLQNKTILPAMYIRFHEFESDGPDLSDMDTVARMIDATGRMGGLSINAVRELANKHLGTRMPLYEDREGNMSIQEVVEGIRAQFMGSPVQMGEKQKNKMAEALVEMMTDTLLHIRNHAKRLDKAA